MACRAVLACVVASMAGSGVFAQDWPQWRGSHRDGVAVGFHDPADWPDALERVWSVEVGPGLSSPVVADGRACTLTRDGNREVAACFALEDGKRLWQQSWESPFFPNGGAVRPRFYPASKGKGPFATPALSDHRLYTMGVDRTLSCFDATNGKLLWRHRFLPAALPGDPKYVCTPCGCADDGKKFDAPGPCPSCGMQLSVEGVETTARSGGGNYYGAAASPLVDGDLAIVHVGNLEQGILLAIDAHSGKERWRHEGPVIAYSSPVVAEIHGVRQIVTMTRTAVIGVSAATGAGLWEFPVENNAHVATPIVLDDLVICARYQGPTFAVRVAKDGERWTAEKAWENTRQTQWLDSPVLDGGRLYGFFFSNKGQFASLDARTGVTLWASDGRRGDAATIVATEKSLVALGSDGSLSILRKQADDYELLRTYQVADSPVWTYPVPFGRNILVKESENLTLWRIE